nr:immunoglobulin light chain junction region [Macaca mulatta]MOY12715.1 immunoglobulin light chain junction region [Macaca mulatta]
CPQYHDLLTF